MPKSKKNHRKERNIKTRTRLWPEIDGTMIWDWTGSKGYVHVPRSMPYIFKIMDECSKNKPVSSTYFSLWCRCPDETGIIKINNPPTIAWESGFSGQRAITTWRTRMRILENLGFIKTKPLGSEKYGYILLLNPYKVIKSLNKQGKLKDDSWLNALYERAEDIKATDLEDDND